MFDITGLSLITGISLSAVKVAGFLLSQPFHKIEWIMEYWNGNDILTVERWDSNWALHIDLEPLKQPGEELYMPFTWQWGDKPSPVEAIKALRVAPTLNSITHMLNTTRHTQ